MGRVWREIPESARSGGDCRLDRKGGRWGGLRWRVAAVHQQIQRILLDRVVVVVEVQPQQRKFGVMQRAHECFLAGASDLAVQCTGSCTKMTRMRC